MRRGHGFGDAASIACYGDTARDLPDVLALAGGVPIKMGEETIGAVGSAGSTLEQDDTCARTGAAKAYGARPGVSRPIAPAVAS